MKESSDNSDKADRGRFLAFDIMQCRTQCRVLCWVGVMVLGSGLSECGNTNYCYYCITNYLSLSY